ncbi:hypothetical protein JMJ58_00735 [Haloterrigena salifodinae]|uniref:Uncharacterized protein n=1 Tax=Haloterrigena salifodinae TaxID=2675099 RepID=A0A8T8E247_9EURY|nr:hypothetical protein [Haloterrigena salifodinae]QRV15461.1 hypothetical protein JMJ58_00735 [Haloterrigena salifodinae]
MKLIKRTIGLETGKVVKLPSEIGRKDTYRFGGGGGSNGHIKSTIVGQDGTEEYVILQMTENEEELPSGSEILGSDVYRDTVWYVVPLSQYGGGT